MTNATVRPALAEIISKLNKIDKVMNDLSTKTKNETVDENQSPTVDNIDCECPSDQVKQEPEPEKEKNGDNDDV